MSLNDDSFTDKELTLMATEIVRDLSVSAQATIDPEDSWKDWLWSEIDMNGHCNCNIDNGIHCHDHDEMELSMLFSDDQTLQLASELIENPLISTSSNDDPYPIAIGKLAVNGWSKISRQPQSQSQCISSKLPYIRPPAMYIQPSASFETTVTASTCELTVSDHSSSIDCIISPRHYIPQPKVSEIPDFTQNADTPSSTKCQSFASMSPNSHDDAPSHSEQDRRWRKPMKKRSTLPCLKPQKKSSTRAHRRHSKGNQNDQKSTTAFAFHKRNSSPPKMLKSDGAFLQMQRSLQIVNGKNKGKKSGLVIAWSETEY